MADVFISYARADKARVAPLVAAIEAKGWSVWWDPEISPGQEFDDQIDAALMSAKAVLVVWTPTSVASRWVRGEARDAADRGVLVPVRFENARLPIDVRAIHTIDLDDWHEDAAGAPAQACLHALGAMIACAQATPPAGTEGQAKAPAEKEAQHCSVCVLPFINMSGDPEQEYFSDGISEDVITDLSKVSALEVVSRNGSFGYKGKHVNAPQIARELNVTHVLEGSVRRAGGRVRITAQLTDGTSNRQVWGERYDRDSSDIFALQDEISHAIVKALRLRLLPEERHAIRQRGTENVEAYNLYLMARQIYVTNQEDERGWQAIVRTCTRATEIDPNYAQAWALMAMGYRSLRQLGVQSDDGMAAAERALALDPGLAEARAVKAQILQAGGHVDAAAAEVVVALKLDPESYEANRAAGRLAYQLHRFDDAVRYYEKAAGLLEGDAYSVFMLISCYTAVNDLAGAQRAAQLAFKRAEAILSHDQNNAGVMVYSAYALATLGDEERARARMNRALLLDPANFYMRYNFACTLSSKLKDKETALKVLGPAFETITEAFLPYAKADPDLASLHDDPRWQAMVAAAEVRLAAAKDSSASDTTQSA
ncbi:MAG: TIR domain-containing protein [Rhodanobacteraceae bacterium]|nr:MAG: TIR domain-containing protein [Rhodanobacteraceae bacterium]